MSYIPNSLVLVASKQELDAAGRVWGTGGWMMPEEREALDWLTLARLLGWGVEVARQAPASAGDPLSGRRWIIIARNPDELDRELVERLSRLLAAESVLVIARAAKSGGAFSCLAGAAAKEGHMTGRDLRWIGPGPAQRWICGKVIPAVPLELTGEPELWATLDDVPLIVARRLGGGAIVTLGVHPSEARDADGAATALLRRLLIWGSQRPAAWLDFDRAMVLRMDDAGGAQNVYSKTWHYPKLTEAAWDEVGRDLARRNARVSVAYISGWVDDGDPGRGELRIAGKAPERIPGRAHPSPLVKYEEKAGHVPGTLHDYESEFRGIQKLRAEGLADVELHGYTHMHPDTVSWAKAPDRYETWPATAWYRELGKAHQPAIALRPPNEHPLVLGIAMFRKYFNVSPTTLISPGDQWTNEILERALELGLNLVSSYYLALREGDRFCWAQHVCSPYLNLPDSSWFTAGLPIVGYFHDQELAVEGVNWMTTWLDRWEAAGARRFMDLRELASAVGCRLRLERHEEGLRLTVDHDGGTPFVRPVPVRLHLAGARLPAQVSVQLNDARFSLPLEDLGDGVGRVLLPPASADTTPMPASVRRQGSSALA